MSDNRSVELMIRQVDEISDLLERDILRASRADPLGQVAGLAILFLIPTFILFGLLAVGRIDFSFNKDILVTAMIILGGLVGMTVALQRFVFSKAERGTTARLLKSKTEMAEKTAARVMVWLDKTNPEGELSEILLLKVHRLRQIIDEAELAFERLRGF